MDPKVPALRGNELPLREVFGIPVAHGAGDEHVIAAAKTDYCGIGPRAIGDVFVRFSDLVGVIKIQWIAVRSLFRRVGGVLSEGAGSIEDETEQRCAANERTDQRSTDSSHVCVQLSPFSR